MALQVRNKPSPLPPSTISLDLSVMQSLESAGKEADKQGGVELLMISAEAILSPR